MCEQTAKESNEIFCLNSEISTTRMVTRQEPVIENHPEDQFETKLFLPEGEGRQGEGGLRTQGYFKKSLPDKPLISVITVVFNGEKYLDETIQSVINQTYDNVEYIIIDGGSNDGTLDIIRKYEHVIDYWISEPDEGISNAFNKGIRCATGSWINFLNAGDTYSAYDILEKMLSYENRGYKIITSYAKFNGYNIYIPNKDLSNNDNNFKKALISHQGSIISHEIFKKHGLFDENIKMRMDYDFWLRVLKYYNFCFINTVSVYYDPYGLSSTNRLQYNYEELLCIIRNKDNILKWLSWRILRKFNNIRNKLK